MIPPWFLSLFSSNAGACAMILPIAMATMETTIKEADEEEVEGLKLYEKGLYIAIAYSATIGGVGTIIATPPNNVVTSNIEADYGVAMSFGNWIAAFLPLSIVLQCFCFAIMYLTYPHHPRADANLPLIEFVECLLQMVLLVHQVAMVFLPMFSLQNFLMMEVHMYFYNYVH